MEPFFGKGIYLREMLASMRNKNHEIVCHVIEQINRHADRVTAAILKAHPDFGEPQHVSHNDDLLELHWDVRVWRLDRLFFSVMVFDDGTLEFDGYCANRRIAMSEHTLTEIFNSLNYLMRVT